MAEIINLRENEYNSAGDTLRSIHESAIGEMRDMINSYKSELLTVDTFFAITTTQMLIQVLDIVQNELMVNTIELFENTELALSEMISETMATDIM